MKVPAVSSDFFSGLDGQTHEELNVNSTKISRVKLLLRLTANVVLSEMLAEPFWRNASLGNIIAFRQRIFCAVAGPERGYLTQTRTASVTSSTC